RPRPTAFPGNPAGIRANLPGAASRHPAHGPARRPATGRTGAASARSRAGHRGSFRSSACALVSLPWLLRGPGLSRVPACQYLDVALAQGAGHRAHHIAFAATFAILIQGPDEVGLVLPADVRCGWRAAPAIGAMA